MKSKKSLSCKSLTLLLMLLLVVVNNVNGIQKWSQQPRYQEVNPRGTIVLPCVIINKKGECRWERDGTPVGIYPQKYEWASSPENGDCSLRILDANLEYDDGVWQCQVTPSSFSVKDALISEGAELVVREKPSEIVIQRVGDGGQDDILASAGEDLELECITVGANPPAKLRWFLGEQEIHTGHRQENSRGRTGPESTPVKPVHETSVLESDTKARTWTSISRLTLPVSKADNNAILRCLAEHPALMAGESLVSSKFLTIHYPPYVTVEHSSLDNLEEERDSVTLRCLANSNPPPKVWWQKEGINGIFNPDGEIVISPITRNSAGTYKCMAENALGLSEPTYVEINVKYSPTIVSVGPSRAIFAQMYNQTRMTCKADGNPPPKYQWLQKLPTHEVLVRGEGPQLLIDNVTYDQQGEYVCKAINEIRGEQRAIQSEPIILEVTGAPQISRFAAPLDVIVQDGEDAILEVRFCADPLPEQLWHLGSNGPNNVILAAGTQHGRFVAEIVRKLRDDCYISTLRINGATPSDSNEYELRLSNSHGIDTHKINLQVREHLSPEILIAIAVVVGCVLTILLLTLFILFAVRADKCCCALHSKKKLSDVESDRTDVESTHSSNISACKHGQAKSSIIPPDALYTPSTRKHQSCHSFQNNQSFQSNQSFQNNHSFQNSHHDFHQGQMQHPKHHHFQYSGYDPATGAVFNDCKEWNFPSLSPPISLNQYSSSSSEELDSSLQTKKQTTDLNTSHYQTNKQTSFNELDISQQQTQTSFNELAFPKSSNYGSTKKAKKKKNVGVECKL